MRLFLLCALLLCVMGKKVLVEIEFDIAPIKEEQESQGQSVSQILTSWLQDANLSWLRYLNTLASGLARQTSSRVAFLEFAGIKEWTEFEKSQKGPTHVLFDIFWLPWRRVPWMQSTDEPEIAPKERQEGAEGYVLSVKYNLKKEKVQTWTGLRKSKLPNMVKALGKSDDFISRAAYTDSVFQSEYDGMILYEFTSLDAVLAALYQTSSIFELTPEVQDCFDSYASTVYQPPYEKGGNILHGEAFREG
eukprot:NODE_3377_length_903_cov_102.148196_g3355_i0.p1 GENE.NODE_3377_length_903_cov_102.148196_g3355_i0~~NODE_3377_length_903_cov_102.148196_g3355_i0.p1  ORF type:complete len:248 (+),score=54.36 NODE_3377_length_903_cov_102.148196_g3355_i0:75-818(+)